MRPFKNAKNNQHRNNRRGKSVPGHGHGHRHGHSPGHVRGPGKEIPLDALQNGEEAVIASVPDMALLPPLGFRPGKKVCIRARGCFGGPIFAEVEKRSVALGRKLACEVKVILADAGEGEHGTSV